MTYSDAIIRLGSRDSRRIANNTYLERRANSDIAVKLHRTDVLTYHADGSVTLNSGGWQTYTTKARMNAYLPYGYRVYQRCFAWYVWNYRAEHTRSNGRIDYFDGLTLQEAN